MSEDRHERIGKCMGKWIRISIRKCIGSSIGKCKGRSKIEFQQKIEV